MKYFLLQIVILTFIFTVYSVASEEPEIDFDDVGRNPRPPVNNNGTVETMKPTKKPAEYTRKVKRYLVAKCGDKQTKEYQIDNSTSTSREGRFMDAVAGPGEAAVVNAMPPTPDQLWRIAYCTPDNYKQKQN